MEGPVPNLVFYGVVSWSTAFVLIRKSLPNFSFNFCNRVVSTVHAVVAVSLASMSVEDWRSPISPLASKPSPRQVFANGNITTLNLSHGTSNVYGGSSRCEPFVSDLRSVLLPIRQASQCGQCGSPSGEHYRNWSWPYLRKVRVGAGGSIVDNRDVEPIPAPARASQGDRLQGHRPQFRSRCCICSNIFISKDGGWALLNLQDSLRRQSSNHQGDGGRVAAGERFLVLQDC
ncbi:uncharacterized protein LOC116190141 isoform X2 [Punica granatum]|uniref:Uncharacterized protein LOC116190141 isoform X2 n=1 Tax=Punica granatum TaxID=22663 RepID=A0A6P8BZM4_PUNGR|nr:uncharacterized protein LOC116190141 isoform X2 [Punica granatum]